MLKRLVAGVALAMAMMAQVAAPPAPANPDARDTAALETYFRHLLMWPAGVEVTIGKPTAAPFGTPREL